MKNRHIVKKRLFGAYRDRKSNRLGKRSVFISHNFSDIEDNENGYWIIHRLVTNAGINAAAEAKAAGITTVYLRDNKLVKVSADGRTEEIPSRLHRSSFYVKYKPSTVLHAVKK